MNAYFLEAMIKEQYRSMWQETEALQQTAYKMQPRCRENKILALLGEKLIQMGEKIRERYRQCEMGSSLNSDTI